MVALVVDENGVVTCEGKPVTADLEVIHALSRQLANQEVRLLRKVEVIQTAAGYEFPYDAYEFRLPLTITEAHLLQNIKDRLFYGLGIAKEVEWLDNSTILLVSKALPMVNGVAAIEDALETIMVIFRKVLNMPNLVLDDVANY